MKPASVGIRIETTSFELINTNPDYIEFRVAYLIMETFYVIDGIGWIGKKGKPKYYLRTLRVNGALASERSYKLGCITSKDSSLVFKAKVLDVLTKQNVSSFFAGQDESQSPDMGDHDYFKLKPRVPGKRSRE